MYTKCELNQIPDADHMFLVVVSLLTIFDVLLLKARNENGTVIFIYSLHQYT